MWFSGLWERIRKTAVAYTGKFRKKTLQKKQKRYKAVRVDEMPEALKPFTIYLCGEGEYLWAAAMICPCGCKEVIQLNLLKDVRPRWTVEEHKDGFVSLMPSVSRQKGCRSHFFVRRGEIDWCR